MSCIGTPARALALLAALAATAPAAAATYTVTSAADSGAGSLRQAISQAGASPGADTIVFAIGSGARTINLATALPVLRGPLTIDATTQPGFSGTPLIRIDGNAVSSGYGLRLFEGGVRLKGLMMTRFSVGAIEIGGGIGHEVLGCYVGTDGTQALGNGTGIYVGNNARDSRIGGTGAHERNVISGNATGVYVANSTGTAFRNNYVGTNAAGTAAVPNTYAGLRIFGDATDVGGGQAGQRNLLSGNGRFGVAVDGGSMSTISGNYIGVDASGNAALGNGEAGISLSASAEEVTIGGTTDGHRNVISGNGTGISSTASFIRIVGNHIGSNAAGNAAVPNTYAGIDVFGDGAIIGGPQPGQRNLISGNSRYGVAISSGSGSTISGNYIGLDAAGAGLLGNLGTGVSIGQNAVQVTLGGTTAGHRNVISGNGSGIHTSGQSVRILNNYVGTNAAGNAARGNQSYALRALGGSGLVIGTPGSGNVFSGNARGVSIEYGAPAVIQGNVIGLSADETQVLGNAMYGGVSLSTADNQLGGRQSGEGNVIAGNDGGVTLYRGGDGNRIEGNAIGVNRSGSLVVGNGYSNVHVIESFDNTIGGTEPGAANAIAGAYSTGVLIELGTGNAILGNRIFDNGWLDVDLVPMHPNANDAGDLDHGPNESQNFPVLTAAPMQGGAVALEGMLMSAPDADYRIEFFHAPACHASGIGGAHAFLGAAAVRTDAAGRATISAQWSAPGSGVVTALATDARGNTSEFSPCVAIGPASAGQFAIWRDPVLAYEDYEAVTITVVRSHGFSGAASVRLVALDGSATAPSDFAATDVVLNFAPGEAIKQVTIPIVLDAVDEGNEGFRIELRDPTGGAVLGARSNVEVLLFDHDDQYPVVTVADAVAVEPAQGTGAMRFAVSMTPGDHPVDLYYWTSSASATPGLDYLETTGQITFQAGERIKIVEIPILADTEAEPEEVFYFHVTSADGDDFVAGDTIAEGIIRDAAGDVIFRDGVD